MWLISPAGSHWFIHDVVASVCYYLWIVCEDGVEPQHTHRSALGFHPHTVLLKSERLWFSAHVARCFRKGVALVLNLFKCWHVTCSSTWSSDSTYVVPLVVAKIALFFLLCNLCKVFCSLILKPCASPCVVFFLACMSACFNSQHFHE